MNLRTHASAALSLVLVFVSLLAEPRVAHGDTAPASAESDPPRVVFLAAGGGSVLDTPHGAIPAGVGSLRVHLPLGHYLALELMATAGYAVGASEPDDAWARLGLGLRAEAADKTFSPFGSFRLVHIHYAPWSIWEHHFGDALAGSSSVGLQHRSGMALATGLRWTIPHTANHLRAMVEVEGSWIPIGDGPEWFVTSEAGLGYSF